MFTPRARRRPAMGQLIQSGEQVGQAIVVRGRPAGSGKTGDKRRAPAPRGFNLMELMIVMAVITIIISIAIPIYTRSIQRAKESVLRNNLFTMRNVIHEYTYDKQKGPKNLKDLVSEGYLRKIPEDPMTGSSDSWKEIQEDMMNAVNQMEPGLFDVRSGSDKTSLDGSRYSDWD